VVLAVHELAANVVCHGGGKGRLRSGIWRGHCTARSTTATWSHPRILRPRWTHLLNCPVTAFG